MSFISQSCRGFGTLDLKLEGRIGLEIESLGFSSQSYREVFGRSVKMGVWSRRRVSGISSQRRREGKGKKGNYNSSYKMLYIE